MKKKNRHLIIFVSIIVILIFSYFSFNLIMNAIIHSNKEIAAPNVEGKSIDEAFNILSSSGLALIKEGEETAPEDMFGLVLKQTPPPGVKIRQGRVIRVLIGGDKKADIVPNLIGKPIRAAVGMIENMKMHFDAFSEIPRESSRQIAKDLVIDQDPPAGAEVKAGSFVTFTISEGPPLIMPDWKNKNIDKARLWAKREKLNIEEIETDQAGTEAGTIVKQEPEPDTDITKYNSVTLYVVKE
ncbi:MAG: PASTA domain-containing protein [Elusimicrobiota bacterium]|jgi:serine/threonine-protein kinase|nr:PASTA domain-containing protein [Elusimicrobiota bacterium]